MVTVRQKSLTYGNESCTQESMLGVSIVRWLILFLTFLKHESLTIRNNNMKKLEDLKELPKNMLEIKEDRSEISLQDFIDNFYT